MLLYCLFKRTKMPCGRIATVSIGVKGKLSLLLKYEFHHLTRSILECRKLEGHT